MNPLMKALEGIGYVLDTPGAWARSGVGAMLGVKDPWSRRVSGKDLLGWDDDQAWGDDIAGFGVEMLLDPLNLVGGGAMGARAASAGKKIASASDDVASALAPFRGNLVDDAVNSGLAAQRRKNTLNARLVPEESVDARDVVSSPMVAALDEFDTEDTIDDILDGIEARYVPPQRRSIWTQDPITPGVEKGISRHTGTSEDALNAVASRAREQVLKENPLLQLIEHGYNPQSHYEMNLYEAIESLKKKGMTPHDIAIGPKVGNLIDIDLPGTGQNYWKIEHNPVIKPPDDFSRTEYVYGRGTLGAVDASESLPVGATEQLRSRGAGSYSGVSDQLDVPGFVVGDFDYTDKFLEWDPGFVERLGVTPRRDRLTNDEVMKAIENYFDVASRIPGKAKGINGYYMTSDPWKTLSGQAWNWPTDNITRIKGRYYTDVIPDGVVSFPTSPLTKNIGKPFIVNAALDTNTFNPGVDATRTLIHELEHNNQIGNMGIRDFGIDEVVPVTVDTIYQKLMNMVADSDKVTDALTKVKELRRQRDMGVMNDAAVMSLYNTLVRGKQFEWPYDTVVN